MSRGMYCTQCEAQGFRKITYWPDRPDVMATFRVRIEGDGAGAALERQPRRVRARAGRSGRTRSASPPTSSRWSRATSSRSRTASSPARGARCCCRSGCGPGDEDRCGYAMDALKRAMAWDERAYGREYDLDRFMIVAVDDFNMGAMENKGLNVFNSRYVLASPETATDADYKSIETIIAHEYFHNWTGNRITCRDWFQLCLKEGLTVFRDQQFSADQRSAGVKRIEDVLRLRAAQFREDAGPLAHPVRPEEYIEINNFYTATVYEKGAEVIGMLRRLVGPEVYAKALDLYFERHDGEACTIEDWLEVFEDASGRDLSQFKLWYSQAGTPRLRVEGRLGRGALPAGARAGDAADAGAAGEGAAGDPGRLRAARAGRRGDGGGGAGARRGGADLRVGAAGAAGAVAPARLLGAGDPRAGGRSRRSGCSCSRTTATPSTSGRRGGPRRSCCWRGWRRTPALEPAGDLLAALAAVADDAGARPGVQGAGAVAAGRGGGDRARGGAGAGARSAGDLGRAAAARGGGGAGARGAAGGALRGERGARALQPRRGLGRAGGRSGRGRSGS